MQVAVVRFPGSNCEIDALRAARAAGAEAQLVWHKDTGLGSADAVVLPGGFAYGDYLRAGAIARFSPIMDAVLSFARDGGPVLGICNGFQVLCEAGLLPGALLHNAGQRFVSRPTQVRVENADTPFTAAYDAGEVFEVPIAHGEGRFVATDDTLRELEVENRVVLRYVGENPNGSTAAIAGIMNQAGNVVGMMPHPERVIDSAVGNNRGAKVFESLALAVGLFPGGTS